MNRGHGIRRSLLLSLLTVCAGCAAPPAPAPSLREQRLASLHRIAVQCGLPDSALKLEGEDQLHVQPPPDASYDSVDCVLTALRKADLPLKMGFVGNEVYETENQQ